MKKLLILKENYYKELYVSETAYKEFETRKSDKEIYAVLDTKSLTYKRPTSFFIGKEGDISLKKTELFIKIEGSMAYVYGELDKELIYLNQRRLNKDNFKLLKGDCIFISDTVISFYPKYIRIEMTDEAFNSKLLQYIHSKIPFEKFPEYKRSPRIVKRVPSNTIELKSPPEVMAADKNDLWMTVAPPLISLVITVAVGLFMGRGIYLIMSAMMTVSTLIVSVFRYIKSKKERTETNKKNKVLYENYLLNKRKEIYESYKKELETYDYNYPKTSKLAELVRNFDSRIYECLATDQDFLTISLGKEYASTSFRISLADKGISAKENPLYEEAKELKGEYSMLQREVILDLKKSNLGLVGTKALIHEQLKAYICRIATFHSYRDLQIVVFYDDKYRMSFDWIKWLPHCRISNLNVYGMVHSEKTRDQIVNSLNQILKERAQRIEESKKESRFLPHFVFIIDEPKYIMDHSIMEYLSLGGDKLGFSIIYTSHLRANLPDFIDTVLVLENSKEGVLLLKEREFFNKTIYTHNNEHVNMEFFARNLSALNHVLGTTSYIPQSVTFFELYKILLPEDLDIKKRWSTHYSDKSLAVPLGLRAIDDIVYLDLHEKAHGPHGLIAGTTGSGKSEIIQSYILSLAVNFHPYEVAFLLIDYKGGGMAGLFKKLPHLLGTITNLDGSESMRALASIKSELARRQRLFSANNVNHINAYMKLFRNNEVTEPIPHLFLISDEFAELKKEQPDFMKELVSTARIGRSLGVHLILATQKPTGVVDEQIWSNSRFKLALKVQNEADSKEILKTADAASITQAGRAYLQVGNNEIYELFQSAWSGAEFVKDKEEEVSTDNRVYVLNDLGQGVLINDDLSGIESTKEASLTQLEAITDYIEELYSSMNHVEVKRPWLPTLSKVVVSPVSKVDFEENNFRELGIEVDIGLMDIPERQEQLPFTLSLLKDGNVAFIASSGYGKSTFLTTIALSLAIKYKVEQLNIFVLDFGNNALITLKQLPHTAEYITLDNKEHYNRFKKLILKEIQSRKSKLSQDMAQNIQVYNQGDKDILPAWVLLIDNFDAVKEMGFEEEEFFTKISRDGVSLGIYMIICATRINAVRAATLNNFKVKVAGFNFEKSEVTYLVGRSQYTLPEIRGRAMVKKDELVSIMQIYSMVDFNSDIDYRNKLNKFILSIKDMHIGQEARHIALMPEEITMSSIKKFTNEDIDLYVGIENEDIFLDGFCMYQSPLTILGAASSGKTNLLKLFIEQSVGKGKIVICDSQKKQLRQYEGMENIEYIKNIEHFISYMDELEQEVIKRENELKDVIDKTKYIRSFEKYMLLIDDLSSFYSHKTTAKDEIADMFLRAADVGILLAATNVLTNFYGNDPVTTVFKTSENGVLLSPQGHLGVVPVNLSPGKNEGVLYKQSYSSIVRIPKV